jgi:hypothetical protein
LYTFDASMLTPLFTWPPPRGRADRRRSAGRPSCLGRVGAIVGGDQDARPEDPARGVALVDRNLDALLLRSGTRRWCSMAFCGNRAKVGRFRQRRRAARARPAPPRR